MNNVMINITVTERETDYIKYNRDEESKNIY